ncbi:sugar transferase [Priestia sp. FSL W8-0001]|uniref:sugar transferase n=1 Tax=unclassified Priestia TaxID=2800374 RepID=UPI0030F7339E
MEGAPSIKEIKVKVKSTIYIKFFKPVIDIVTALITLIVSSPIFVLIFLAIKLDSKGPAIFRQPRIGYKGEKFTIFKFRTMYTVAPSQGKSPTSSFDPRITRVGRFLRKTSLDELPQLFNILLGQMSFIGPRPEQELIVKEYYGEYESQRFLVKPGITGLWQISEHRTQPIHDHLEHDFVYINNVCFTTDMRVILGTVQVMLIKSNTH